MWLNLVNPSLIPKGVEHKMSIRGLFVDGK